MNREDFNELTYGDETIVEKIIRLRNEGYTVRFPEPNEVFIDLDSHDAHTNFYACLRNVQQLFKCRITYERASKSGISHSHIIVTFERELTPLERILLQALLGSDQMRELLALRDIWEGREKYASIFFEKEYKRDNDN